MKQRTYAWEGLYKNKTTYTPLIEFFSLLSGETFQSHNRQHASLNSEHIICVRTISAIAVLLQSWDPFERNFYETLRMSWICILLECFHWSKLVQVLWCFQMMDRRNRQHLCVHCSNSSQLGVQHQQAFH